MNAARNASQNRRDWFSAARPNQRHFRRRCDQTRSAANKLGLCLLKTQNACDSRALEKLEGFVSWSAHGSGDSTAAPLNPKRLERADYPLYSQTAETPGRRSDR